MPEKECNKTACCAARCQNECSIVGHANEFTLCLLGTCWAPTSKRLEETTVPYNTSGSSSIQAKRKCAQLVGRQRAAA